MSTSLHRLAIVVSHPTQYYSPWFAHVATISGLELRVFYLWNFGVTPTRDREFGRTFSWDVDLLSGYDHEFVPNVAELPGTHHFKGLINPQLLPRLRQFGPKSVLVFGYKYRSHLQLIRAAKKEGWRLLFRGDSHLLGHPRPGWIKRLLLRCIFRRFDYFLYVGQANRDYFKTFGVTDERLIFAPHAVDAVRFAQRPSAAAIAQARQKLDIKEGSRVILFVGKLTGKKAPLDLLEAYSRLPDGDHLLLFSGDGEERNALVAATKARDLKNVRFLTFANQSEMPLRYAMADLFALPSSGLYETWGLAVNEAMHGGLPCIVSDRVGCQQDLITPNRTGWVFPAGDVDALTIALQQALTTLDDPLACKNLQAAIKDRMQHYTYTQTTAGLLTALNLLSSDEA